MRKHYTPVADATLYEDLPNRQTGFDEILEVGNADQGQYTCRSLLKFDLDAISSSLSDGTYPPETEFDLKLHLARGTHVELGQMLELYPVSESWEEGSGYYYQDRKEETNGATWKVRESASLWADEGGSYLTSPSVSLSSPVPPTDVVFDVSDIVRDWVSGSFENYGLLLKYPDADEENYGNKGRLMFFSKDTHTVFQPTLIAKWDDSSYLTGSLEMASARSLIIRPKNLRYSYKNSEVVRVDVKVRPEYYPKTFETELTIYTRNQRLPETAWFSIVDVQSQEVIIPFDDYSKISCDGTTNYIKFGTEKMFPLRYYKILFKAQFSDGTEVIVDEERQFGITQ